MSKQAKITIASVLFLITAIVDVYAVISKNELLEIIFKPLLMTTLVIVYLVAVKKPNFWFVSALFFSFWGDVLLLFKEQFFVFGLASFLLAHVLYIKITARFLKKIPPKIILLGSLPFVIFFFSLLYLIKDNLGEMLIPVAVYGITISTFGALTFLNYINKKNTANLWLFLGALIFIASDSLIATNKFYEVQEIYSVLIMVTYILAQYLICKAIIAKSN